ncbi:hypothetical protein EPA93_46020 [Ktedonosporobacter rubrisoli]|uniref:Uncharacterized protein n=1 Tax=Ktedonosporobacter rubrisoli TaxID=2509675 RepID=A0A4P6K4T5_KTERU|nr:hypothetical protein [Ktedonosporobacter rubrisoli]QBD82933.1 hypothetical protein EPA93_46020 [Ktedonosporobacter rubrisoli]
MRKYCKAYLLKDLRRFAGWKEPQELEGEALTDESVVYIWDDFTVVRSPVVPEKGVIWDQVTQAWREFCQDELHFEIPQDLRSEAAHTTQAP